MKIDKQNFINILLSVCIASDLQQHKSTSISSVFEIGELESKWYIILKGKVSVFKPYEEKKQMTQLE